MSDRGPASGPYLTREQIRALVDRVGQPRASVLLNELFKSYCGRLESSDVAALYDDEYRGRIASHETHETVGGKFRIHAFNRHSFDYLRTKVAVRARILDVGCGDGEFALALAASGAGRVLGLDFSPEAIEAARRKLEGSGLPCEFLCGDVASLSPDGEFDFVTLNDVTEHLSDRELGELLSRLAGILAAGGELIIHTPNGFALCNGTDGDLVVRLYRLYLRVRAGWQGLERTVEQLYYDQAHINIKSYRQLRLILQRHGFDARVFYDDTHLPLVLRRMSSNMLVVARRSPR